MSSASSWMPFDQYIRNQFFMGIEEQISVLKVYFDYEYTKEEVWQYAKRRFKEMKQFNILTEDDLNFYNPEKYKQ